MPRIMNMNSILYFPRIFNSFQLSATFLQSFFRYKCTLYFIVIFTDINKLELNLYKNSYLLENAGFELILRMF